jgi:hypothetical protein
MKRFLLALAICLALLSGSAAAQDAQPSSEGAPTLSNLEIALWPEFDRPEMLVIYRGVFSSDTPLPVAVEIRLPAAVGRPTAVAYVGETGDRFNQEYTTRIEGDSVVVSFELATPGFQLEYYDELPTDSGNQRSYTFGYAADYPIAALNLEFQVPPTAEGFALEPPADSVVLEADGLVYHLVQAGTVAQGETGTWALAYLKDNADLTAEGFAQTEPPAAAPAAAPTAESTDNSAVLIFLIAFVALFGVGAGAYWLGRRVEPPSRTAPPPKRSKRRGSGRGPQQHQARSPSEGITTLFCHKCGTQLRADSEFCHRCGATVRTE